MSGTALEKVQVLVLVWGSIGPLSPELGRLGLVVGTGPGFPDVTRGLSHVPTCCVWVTPLKKDTVYV